MVWGKVAFLCCLGDFPCLHVGSWLCHRWWSRSWRTWGSLSTSPASSTRCWSSPTVSGEEFLASVFGPLWAVLTLCLTLLLLLFTGYVTTIIEDAKIYATHAKKSTVDADDIKLAIQCRMDQSFTSPPPRDVSRPQCQLQRFVKICSGNLGIVAHSHFQQHLLGFQHKTRSVLFTCGFIMWSCISSALSSCWRWPDRKTRPLCR